MAFGKVDYYDVCRSTHAVVAADSTLVGSSAVGTPVATRASAKIIRSTLSTGCALPLSHSVATPVATRVSDESFVGSIAVARRK